MARKAFTRFFVQRKMFTSNKILCKIKYIMYTYSGAYLIVLLIISSIFQTIQIECDLFKWGAPNDEAKF